MCYLSLSFMWIWGVKVQESTPNKAKNEKSKTAFKVKYEGKLKSGQNQLILPERAEGT